MLYGTLWIIFLAYLTKELPVGYQQVAASLKSVHPELEDASRIFGATRLRALADITAPLIRNGVIATWILIFIGSIRELSATILLFTAKTKTISVTMFDLRESNDWGPIAVLSITMLAHHLRDGRRDHLLHRPEACLSALPLLGLMLGDATGIGPEQCARVLADRRLADAARLVVFGDARVLEQGARDAGVELAWRSCSSPDDVDWTSPEVPIVDLRNLDPNTIGRGAISADSGRITGETLKVMIDLALDGRLDGICFAPLNKAALHAGGWKFNDEHQMFAHLTGHRGFFGEMNVLDDKWMSRVTSHVSLRTALDQITPQRIDDALTLADATMRGAGFATPRIAVAALNPHGGEGGLFGREEIEIIAPAVAKAAARGIACQGPFPADTVFLKGFGAATSTACSRCTTTRARSRPSSKGFNRGVTVTGGLATVFTTPAHGTAFDIVGKGIATTGALEQAVRLCARLSQTQSDSEGSHAMTSTTDYVAGFIVDTRSA